MRLRKFRTYYGVSNCLGSIRNRGKQKKIFKAPLFLCKYMRARVCEYLNEKANERCEYAMELFERKGERVCMCVYACVRKNERE